MAQRNGLRTIRDIAYKMCRLIGIFDPIIRRAFPSETALHNALDLVSTACQALVVEADSVLPVGD